MDGIVAVNLLHLDGDGQADLKAHGGRNKAIYVYPGCHYETWEKELGTGSLDAAQFGENLTVSGMSETNVIIGSRYKLGTAQVTVTQPRLPCFKLGVRMNDPSFPNKFISSGRLGFYLRVEEVGQLQAGDTFTLLDRPAHGISVHNLWQFVFGEEPMDGGAERVLHNLSRLDSGWRRRLRQLEGK